jgi:acyl dehydratase
MMNPQPPTLLGQGIAFEQQRVGSRFRTCGRTVTEADLVNFIGATGMLEPLFTNLQYLQTESVIKGRPVPAALAYSFAEAQLIQGMLLGVGMAFLGMEMQVKGPVLVGDTIHVEVEVLEARRSGSRPGVGLVKTRNSIINQRGETVLEYTPLRMIKLQDSA